MHTPERARVSRPIELRPMTADDAATREDILVLAYQWHGNAHPTREWVLQHESPVYLAQWGRQGDCGQVALQGGVPVGAIWSRLFELADETWGHVSTDLPEIVALGVFTSARGRGVGGALLDGFLEDLAQAGHLGASLSVEDGNDPARRLYASRGFVKAGRKGDSDILALQW